MNAPAKNSGTTSVESAHFNARFRQMICMTAVMITMRRVTMAEKCVN
jgi:hypothetical protein